MEILLMAFGVAWLLTLLAVRVSRRFAHLAHDHDLSGPQKMHTIPVPRIGGIGIFGSVLGVVVFQSWRDGAGLSLGVLLLVAALPAFGAGLIEDLTKRVSPRRRLFATALSAVLAATLVGAQITRTDIPGIDWLVATAAGAMLITVFVVSGVRPMR